MSDLLEPQEEKPYYLNSLMRFFKSVLGLSWMATLFALAVGIFIWYDNIEGFRSAEAFSTLLGTVFSLIATVWLIATVVTQGEELKLQRNELSQQRAETSRIAAESHAQSLLMQAQTKMLTKQYIIDHAISIFSSELLIFEKDRKKIYLKCMRIAQARINRPIRSKDFFIDPMEDAVCVRLFYKSFKLEKSDLVIPIDYSEFDLDVESYRYRAIFLMQESAKSAGIEMWFRNELPTAIGRRGSLKARDITLLINLSYTLRTNGQ